MRNAGIERLLQFTDVRDRSLDSTPLFFTGEGNSLLKDLSVQELGFDHRTAQDPVPLLVQVDRVVEDVRSGKADASDPVFEGDDFTPAKYADHLEKSAGNLRQALDQVAERQREAEKAMLDKREVTKEYDTLFLHGARSFESYCRLVGKTELADRLRPSENRPGRTETIVDEDVEDSDPAESETSADVES